MSPQRWLVLPIVLVFVACVSPGSGQDKKDEPKKDDKQSVDSKAEKRATAGNIDFRKEYGLPFNSLGTIGSRIDTARRAHDPVSLAHMASELATAEKISGKKATLTSTTLAKEAAELAKLRRQQSELEAMLHLSSQLAQEETTIASLKESIASAKQQAKDETAAVQRNEEPTGPRKLLINNYTTQYADIWVNGYLKIQVPPGESRYCTIEHKWNPTVLKAYGTGDDTTWGPRTIWGTFKTYTWNLN
ncbi:MAG: hypothetical protein K2R98_06170 [Gemmataceae bacterium]|nr:hypothetical protein [Gemmataceae bacterium]